MGYGLVNGFIDHLYTPLGTTLCRLLTQANVLSLLVSTSRFLSMASTEGDSSALVLRSSRTVTRAELFVNWQLNWVPRWWLFHTNLLIFSSQSDFQLTTEVLITLAMASIEGDSSAFSAKVLLSQPPVQNSCQLTTQLSPRLVAISHQPPSLLFTGWLQTDNSLQLG
jgi:hypothetical protein